jgi:hypothetical protein
MRPPSELRKRGVAALKSPVAGEPPVREAADCHRCGKPSVRAAIPEIAALR